MTETSIDKKVDEETGAWWWIRSVLSWTILLAMFALLTVVILVPTLAGAERFTVLTGSMKPTYPPGTLLVVKPVERSELGIGMPITYQLRPGEPAVVTHRIISASQSAQGTRTYITQGDANDVPDEAPVIYEQIRGRVWYSIPYLGYVNNWLTGQNRSWTIGIVATSLFAYAAFLVVSGARDGRRERRTDAARTNDVPR
ncbi:signal peptidase I [Rhodococcus rhodochrous]|uniref:signal peptidase I n=1 Tax=Rhodococcus rhodochrous TaxID=1829 RepID=UPI000D04BB50|nr:signal peptidase I [Rhodococcus rhodochrous]AYA23740.1 signal peptidase I [Rhodococcus rhodochrous]MCD2099254.1 signal peptidase I [Rhodococcus rhodochrous]MCD2120567.1 signal peptidase I [Rhodococcus rhodochrous]MCQ4136145.1 signal peptidase I [Rhodococcus rhodochrous]MDJ0017433.1 signal peptidase I [Rhodococcus rhodochrous]